MGAGHKVIEGDRMHWEGATLIRYRVALDADAGFLLAELINDENVEIHQG